MSLWTKWMLQGMDRVVSPTVPNSVTLDTDMVQGQWPAKSGQGFCWQHPLLLLQAKCWTAKDISCTLIPSLAPDMTPWFPLSSRHYFLSSFPSQVQPHCKFHPENLEAGTQGETGEKGWTDHTKVWILGIFSSFTPKILSEDTLLEETFRCCFNQLQRNYFLLNW